MRRERILIQSIILVNSRQRAKAKDNQGKLTQQALLVLQGPAKLCPQTGMRREDYVAQNPTGPNYVVDYKARPELSPP
jgi:3-methyladenine DNA glycosylase Mpg